jgi:uncharacterized protein YggE
MQLHRIVWISALLLVASALAGAGAPTLIRAESGTPASGTVSVVGNGSVETQPDTAAASFGITTQAQTAHEAMSLNSQAMAKVIDALKRAGIAGRDLQTQYVSVEPRYDGQGREVTGYMASNSVSATVRKLSRVGDVIDVGIAAGADNVSGPSLSRADRDKLYDEALESAVSDAKAKADVLAHAAGVSLGAVESVTENPQMGGAVPLSFAALRADAETPIEPGRTNITASVRVVFAID